MQALGGSRRRRWAIYFGSGQKGGPGVETNKRASFGKPLLLVGRAGLLEACRSVKVKRLFLYMAENQGLPWLAKLDLSKVHLGAGKRMIVLRGRYDAVPVKMLSCCDARYHICDIEMYVPDLALPPIF
jgi:hypothetical protein